ncbi:hypothetical protein PCAR4_20056 [Paraburkholderia caribensis]|nr:hypothetical protein PCAR4_20056 [Paraburkholderia caribensis]
MALLWADTSGSGHSPNGFSALYVRFLFDRSGLSAVLTASLWVPWASLCFVGFEIRGGIFRCRRKERRGYLR